MKKTVITVLAVMAGNVVFDRFIAKTEDSGSGFIEVTPGIGLDDAVRALTIVGALMLAHRFGGGK